MDHQVWKLYMDDQVYIYKDKLSLAIEIYATRGIPYDLSYAYNILHRYYHSTLKESQELFESTIVKDRVLMGIKLILLKMKLWGTYEIDGFAIEVSTMTDEEFYSTKEIQ